MKPIKRRRPRTTTRAGRPTYDPSWRHVDASVDPVIEAAIRVQNRTAAEDIDGFGWWPS